MFLLHTSVSCGTPLYDGYKPYTHRESYIKKVIHYITIPVKVGGIKNEQHKKTNYPTPKEQN